MAYLYDAGEHREKLAILMALTQNLADDYLWRVLGYPYWHGVNLNFAALIGAKAQQQDLCGDVDILGVPGVDGTPDFNSMFAVEVKTLKFSLDDKLKGLGSKLDEAEAQADKLQRLGFHKTAILYILTTENTPDRDLGGSSGWFGAPDSASDRAIAAFDHFRPMVKDRPRHHHVFVWPWGSHPSKGDYKAGAGCPQFIGGPKSATAPTSTSEATTTSNRATVVENMTRMIQDLPRPPVWGQTPWATVFGHCPTCSGIIQHFWDGRLCKTCGWAKNSDQ